MVKKEEYLFKFEYLIELMGHYIKVERPDKTEKIYKALIADAA